MAYDFMPVNEQHIPSEIKSAITMHKPYRPMNGNISAGTIKLDNGSEYFIQPDVRTNGFIAKRVYETDENEEDLVLRGWGMYNEYDPWFREDERLFNWLDHQIRYELDGINFTDGFKFAHRIRAFQPMRSKIASGKVAVYLTQQQRDDDRQVAMRPGRSFSAMFPEIPHKNIISLVDKFLREFAERDFNLHVSQEADAFTRAYSGKQSPTENIHTSCNRKHSAHSCMRYDFDDLPVHPVTAYASGDFEIIYATDQNGDIAARCVVCLKGKTPSAGPIYGVSEQALDFIHNHMIGKGYLLDANWVGARLKRISHRDDGFIAPYLDPQPQRLYDSGTHLVISTDGEIDASVYRGVLNDFEYRCCECGEGMYEEDYYYSECTDNHYCEGCHGNTHFYCEHEGQYYHESEAMDVYYLYRGSVSCEIVSRVAVEYRDEFVFCNSDDEYWKEEDTFWCEYEGEHIDPKTYDKHYFRSDWDCEVYPNDLMCITEDDEHISTEEIDDDVWYKNEDNIYCRKENK